MRVAALEVLPSMVDLSESQKRFHSDVKRCFVYFQY